MDGASYYEMTLDINRAFYRVYEHDGIEGKWLLNFNPVGMSGSGLKDMAALPKIPASAAEVFIPAGTKIKVSVAGKNNYGKGGLMQYKIPGIVSEGYKSAGITFKNTGALK
jgi:hypothetical protein